MKRDDVFDIQLASLDYNRQIEDILFEHSHEVVQILFDVELVTNLTKIDLVSTPSSPKRAKRFGIIYALFHNGALIKIGMTFWVEYRIKEYRNQYKDFDDDYQMVELVPFDSIPLEVEQRLSMVLSRFVDAVIANESTPEGMQLFFVGFRDRGWHRGGLKKQWLIQLCEIGLQRYYNRFVRGEAFSWDQGKYNRHTNKAREVAQELVNIVGEFGSILVRYSDMTLFGL